MSLLGLFFPGVFVHEVSHAIACFVSNVPVHRVEVGWHSGRVIHDQGNVRTTFLIGFSPLVIGFLFSVFLFSLAKSSFLANF